MLVSDQLDEDTNSVDSKSTVSSSNDDDEETSEKEAAAALCVDVGSLENPKDIPGLAHLLEHVIFMGNDKYPEENGLDAFLGPRSGNSNATTFYQRTLFEVEVPKKHLEEALQRFAYCFISPLLQESSIEKEISPVDTEFLEGLSNDDSRLEQFFTLFAKESHGLGTFSWGNKKSLIDMQKATSTNLRKRLVEFWKKYYIAEKMVLVVQSQETFQTLDKWVQVFSLIPSVIQGNRQMPPSRVPELPYDLNKFHRLYYIKPILDFHRILISWSIPSQLQLYATKPMAHIGSLIGHEGKGGLISVLRRRGLATSLSAGNDEGDSSHNIHHAIFSIDITLTQEGLHNLDEVVRYVSAFIQLLNDKMPQQQFYEEEARIELIKMRFEDEMGALSAATTMAKHMFVYHEENCRNILVGPLLFLKYDEEIVGNCLQQLVMADANFIVMSPKILADEEYTEREPWMNISYMSKSIPDNWKQEPSADIVNLFRMPKKNEFIPEDFGLKKEDSAEYPEAILNGDHYRLWFKKDDQFKIPKGCINLVLLSNLQKESAKYAACLDLFIEILSINISEEVYPADLAGLEYSIYVSDIGLILTTEGFSDVLPNLVELLVESIADFDADDQTFDSMKEKLAQNYYNSFTDSSKLAKSIRYAIFQPVYHTSIEKRNVLPSISKQDILDTHQRFFSSLHMECLIQGNFTKAKATKIAKSIHDRLSYESVDTELLPRLQVNALHPRTQSYCRVKCFCKAEKNSLVTNYYQIGPCDIKTFCRLDLLGNYMYEPAFDELRTKQGLGYNVMAQHHDTFGIGGYSITVNSPADQFTCSEIDSKIEAFLVSLAKQICEMSEERYESLRTSRILTKSGPDLHLKEEVDRNWDEIISFNYCFDRLKKEVKHLEQIPLKEFQRWSIDHLKSCARRKLSVQVVGNGQRAQDECNLILDERVTDERRSPTPPVSGTINSIYSLYYLLPKSMERGKLYVQQIDAFKRPLEIFPVTRVTR
ncbi:Nardilysin [Halotydeus destructor]|nr:Nardilysin [Halotydeus destructor]